MHKCPDYKNCLRQACSHERVCLNGDYWSEYWKQKALILPGMEESLSKLAETIVCCYCNEEIIYRKQLTIEHLVPVSKGGNSTPGNKRKCCVLCNTDRGKKSYEIWIEE